jgi:phosphoribosylanthranilate isomerase
MTRIKICGITNKTDAINAAALGVDMLGFVFYAKSGRFVAPKVVRDIANDLPVSVSRVGVFVNEDADKVLQTAFDIPLDILQFHGDETPDYCEGLRKDFKVIKAFRIKDRASLKKVNDYSVDFFLFDTYRSASVGGTGRTFDRKILKDYEFLRPVILSGGLTPENVQDAIRDISPYGVDVSTGVEASVGKKDMGLVKKFVVNVRKAE